MNRREPSSVERAGPGGQLVWRRKGGLETPLSGRWHGERRKLSFAPPLWYDALVNVCIVGGCAYAILGLFFGERLPLGAGAEVMFISLLFALAGLWAALSSERMVCDLRTKTYARLEGYGLRRRKTRGSLNELDALVLVSEIYPLSVGVGSYVVYRLVLYWKNSKEPLLVVERQGRQLGMGDPINLAAGDILKRGQEYAHALGIKYFDNSYFHSSGPVPVV